MLGQAILRARRQRGLSQEGLAAEAGLSRTAVQSVERGGSRGRAYTKLGLAHVEIARVLGWSLEDLERKLINPATPVGPEPLYAVLLRSGDDANAWYKIMDMTTDRELAEAWVVLSPRRRLAVIGHLVPVEESSVGIGVAGGE